MISNGGFVGAVYYPSFGLAIAKWIPLLTPAVTVDTDMDTIGVQTTTRATEAGGAAQFAARLDALPAATPRTP